MSNHIPPTNASSDAGAFTASHAGNEAMTKFHGRTTVRSHTAQPGQRVSCHELKLTKRAVAAGIANRALSTQESILERFPQAPLDVGSVGERKCRLLKVYVVSTRNGNDQQGLHEPATDEMPAISTVCGAIKEVCVGKLLSRR